ncbi:MAG: DUF4275 family protein [Clostridia bacterium]|nr:DUF4275 family protein [Clostridia bacterium]
MDREEKIFGFLESRYGLKHVYQCFENCYDGHWFVYSHSYYNESGCFTIQVIPQRGEYDFYFTKKFLQTKEPLCSIGLEDSAVQSVDIRSIGREIWEKAEKKYWFWTYKRVLKTLASAIRDQVGKESSFFGIEVEAGQKYQSKMMMPVPGNKAVPMTSEDFAKRFIEVFSKNVSEEEFAESISKAFISISKKGIKRSYKQYVTHKEGYLWMRLSYGIIPFFEGDEARREYDKADKTDAFEIYYYCEGLCYPETATISNNHLTAKMIDDDDVGEFYIIGKDFAWCYVVTHAGDGAGPYFCYAPKQEE